MTITTDSAALKTRNDTHWNYGNIIYGDKKYKEGETKIPDISAIRQSTNLYVYAMNNPITYVDPSGEIAYPGQIHNAVVNHIQMKYAVSGMQKNKMIDYSFGFGYADLVNVNTGEVWEVKRNTLSVPKALQQLTRYISNRLHDKKYSEKQLVAGGSKGTYINPDCRLIKITKKGWIDLLN